MTEALDKKYTVEEYLAFERKAAVKHLIRSVFQPITFLS